MILLSGGNLGDVQAGNPAVQHLAFGDGSGVAEGLAGKQIGNDDARALKHDVAVVVMEHGEFHARFVAVQKLAVGAVKAVHDVLVGFKIVAVVGDAPGVHEFMGDAAADAVGSLVKSDSHVELHNG